MTDSRGGARSGAGRPTGSKSIPNELREAAQKHTQDAITAIIEIMQDEGHPQRLKAAEAILERGYGKAGEHNPGEQIIMRFVSGEASAIEAGLLLEAHGLKVPDLMQRYLDNEIKVKTYDPNYDPMSFDLNEKPQPLPKN